MAAGGTGVIGIRPGESVIGNWGQIRRRKSPEGDPTKARKMDPRKEKANLVARRGVRAALGLEVIPRGKKGFNKILSSSYSVVATEEIKEVTPPLSKRQFRRLCELAPSRMEKIITDREALDKINRSKNDDAPFAGLTNSERRQIAALLEMSGFYTTGAGYAFSRGYLEDCYYGSPESRSIYLGVGFVGT